MDNIIIKIRIGHWRISFSFAPVADTVGVNSTLKDGNHILMWDFDEVKFDSVVRRLRGAQIRYKLPRIFVLDTGKPNSYIAYCFARVDFPTAVSIITSVGGVCWNFIKYGVYRGHFTLRVTPKCFRKPKLACILPSDRPDEVTLEELTSWTQYETLADGYEPKKWEWVFGGDTGREI